MIDLVVLGIGLVLGALCACTATAARRAMRRIGFLEDQMALLVDSTALATKQSHKSEDRIDALDRDVGKLAMHAGISRHGGSE